MNNLDYLFSRLSKSKFRSSFHLKEKDKEYVRKKGLDEVIDHAYGFVDKRLSVLNENDAIITSKDYSNFWDFVSKIEFPPEDDIVDDETPGGNESDKDTNDEENTGGNEYNHACTYGGNVSFD